MLIKRLFIYQKERFPFLKNGLLIFMLTISTMGLFRVIQQRNYFPSVCEIFIVFIIIFIYFLQLRIADEFKDYEEDSKYRAYRAVPRGLVTLKELRNVGIFAFLLQILLIILFNKAMLIYFFIIYVYFFLMTKEFFAPLWLNKHQGIYMISHTMIIILFHLFVILYDLEMSIKIIFPYVIIFLLIGFFNGMCIEVGRKIRAPKDEENGVTTYSKIWGIRNSIFILILIEIITFILCIVVAKKINFFFPIFFVLLVLIFITVIIGYKFIKKAENGEIFEKLSGIWILAVYLMLGVVPLIKG